MRRFPQLRHSAVRGLALAALLLFVACDQAPEEPATPAPPQIQRLSGFSMGTNWSVQFVPPERPDDQESDQENNRDLKALRDSLGDDIETALETVNAQMSTYREDSLISRFNRLPAGESITLPPEFAAVLTTTLELAEQTDGAFDPTVGPLVNLWGFGPEGIRDEAPPKAAVEAARARVGWDRLEFEPDSRQLTQPGGAYLDLSSTAKGYAVDLISEHLEARGVTDYLVDIGGDMRARGRKPGGRQWRVAVERPTPGERGIHSIINPDDQAVATSGSYRNFFREGEQEYSHTIDPRSGYPIPRELVSVTVVHESAKWADGFATAITALGPEAGYAFARDRDLAVLLLIRDNGSVRERMTPPFANYLETEAN